MILFITKAWKWFTDNPLAQWVAGIIVAFFAWETLKRELKKEGAKEERKINEIETAKTIDRIEEKSNERIEQADRIRAANPVSPADPSVSVTPLPPWNYRD